MKEKRSRICQGRSERGEGLISSPGGRQMLYCCWGRCVATMCCNLSWGYSPEPWGGQRPHAIRPKLWWGQSEGLYQMLWTGCRKSHPQSLLSRCWCYCWVKPVVEFCSVINTPYIRSSNNTHKHTYKFVLMPIKLGVHLYYIGLHACTQHHTIMNNY